MNVEILAQYLSSPCGDWANCCQRALAQMAFLHSAACCWERCCRCAVWHCGSVVHSGAAWYTVVSFLRRLWNRLHFAMHSGAVCDTVRCVVCPVVPFVTLGLVLNPSLLWRHSYKIATLINLYVPLQRGHCWFVKLHHKDWLTLVVSGGDCWDVVVVADWGSHSLWISKSSAQWSSADVRVITWQLRCLINFLRSSNSIVDIRTGLLCNMSLLH